MIIAHFIFITNETFWYIEDTLHRLHHFSIFQIFNFIRPREVLISLWGFLDPQIEKMEDEVNHTLHPYILDAYEALNEYIREQRDLLAANDYDNQFNLDIYEAITRFTNIATIRIEFEYAYIDHLEQQQQNSLQFKSPKSTPAIFAQGR